MQLKTKGTSPLEVFFIDELPHGISNISKEHIIEIF